MGRGWKGRYFGFEPQQKLPSGSVVDYIRRDRKSMTSYTIPKVVATPKGRFLFFFGRTNIERVLKFPRVPSPMGFCLSELQI